MLNKSFKIYIAVIFIVIVAGTIFYVSRNNNGSLNFTSETKKLDNAKNDNKSVINLAKTYTNGKISFSFNYPDGFTVSEFAEADGKIALTVQNAKTGEGLQIYITAYDDPNFVANKKSILSDVPDMLFLNSTDVVIGGKAKGTAFFSQNEAFGDTAEVWFAKAGHFYQATAYRKDVWLLEAIIKSWEFRK